MSLIKIGYDAGHGYNTLGKRTPDGEREWYFNDKVARAFANELAFYEGVASKRFDDPTGKTDVSLNARTNGANAWNADYYISFHHNANAGKWAYHTGIETFYSEGSTKGLALAKAIHPAMVDAYGLEDRGLKTNNLHITRETKMPAILVEGGFMDSYIDIKKLRDHTVLENAGKSVARAFAKFAGLKRIDEKPEGGLTVGQYEELKATIAKQSERIEVLEAQVGLNEREVLKDHAVAWKWAQEQGLMNGKNPNRPLTREQFATIEYRKAKNVK
ncbi:MAG: N-acetylmuramoyl-L-alanine amidase [Psychrobacillus sp.]